MNHQLQNLYQNYNNTARYYYSHRFIITVDDKSQKRHDEHMKWHVAYKTFQPFFLNFFYPLHLSNLPSVTSPMLLK